MKELRLDGIIGDFLNTAEDFAYRLEELNLSSDDELILKINSPGGSVFDGFSMFNQIKALDNKVSIRIEGLAASIASLIALAGDHVSMTEVGSFMIHRASTMAAGNTDDLESVADSLKQIDETLVNVYVTKTGLETSEIEEMMDKETWMSPETAKKKGFIDEVEETLKAVAFLNSNQKINMKKLDELFTKLGLVKSEGEQPKSEEEEETPVKASEEEEETKSQEEEEEEERKKKEEEEEEEEAKESDQLKDLITAIEALVERVKGQEKLINSTRETLSALNDGMASFVDNRVKQIAKGIKSNGEVPLAQSNFGGVPQTWVPKYQGFKKQMAEIDKKTRATL